jgi:hypothetical protein
VPAARSQFAQVYVTGMRTYQATGMSPDPGAASMSDAQLLDIADMICMRFDAGWSKAQVEQWFGADGIPPTEADLYINRASELFCQEHFPG